jgi:hypothetical protein
MPMDIQMLSVVERVAAPGTKRWPSALNISN